MHWPALAEKPYCAGFVVTVTLPLRTSVWLVSSEPRSEPSNWTRDLS